jgi:hypothetical protein
MAQPQHGAPACRNLNGGGSPQHQSPNPPGITSLTDPTPKLPWNHIVTKNIGRGGLTSISHRSSRFRAGPPTLASFCLSGCFSKSQ